MSSAEPGGADVWAMQIVVHLPRPGSPDGEPPSRRALLEAAASAVGRLVEAAYADDADPAWAEAIRRYEDGWIRKVVRRARGIGWRRVQDLPGVGVTHDGASVRALLPGPGGDLPDAVRKLQVGGTEVDDAAAPRASADPAALAVALNPSVTMTAGKAAAQAGHAAQLAWHAMPPDRRRAWARAGCPVVLVPATGDEWAAAGVVVRDGGLTEVPPGTTTAVAWW